MATRIYKTRNAKGANKTNGEICSIEKNISTTKNHYIADDENSLIAARNKVKLRD